MEKWKDFNKLNIKNEIIELNYIYFLIIIKFLFSMLFLNFINIISKFLLLLSKKEKNNLETLYSESKVFSLYKIKIV